ncbi:cytochrome c3 family protein [Geobacter sp. AOG1]|uniref:cytochrome c3 family protein n=1 Tax=Geobacter sp. AOG1 TaxID=1566346 RepID=UPI001CC79F47|nr:cytochrome c3 family protein [Geobacter sp. AOG1]GFE57618.1 cytochrome c [Geobacter sp. AOG1]
MKTPKLVRLAIGLAMATALMVGTAFQTMAAEPAKAPAKAATPAKAAAPAAKAAAPAPAKAKVALTNDDCVKCHAGPPADIEAAGGWHKKVGCNNCHEGHRPSSKNNIPNCNQCHEGKPHYTLKGQCGNCHKNPHRPKDIAFASNVTDPCVTCHTQQIAQLKEFKSKHSGLYCSTCHNVHGRIPQCVQCHKPHAPTMVQADCAKCHKAHQPKNVKYASTVPSKDCAACHKKAFDLLTNSTSKHKSLACVYCHQEKHKMVPKCQDCHGVPHPAGMLARFPKCGDCHNIAHDLNHWSSQSTAAPGKPAAPAKPAKKK